MEKDFSMLVTMEIRTMGMDAIPLAILKAVGLVLEAHLFHLQSVFKLSQVVHT
jgi:hypothetical protein